MRSKGLFSILLLISAIILLPHSIYAAHGSKLGTPVDINGFRIKAFYIQAVKAKMPMAMKDSKGKMIMPSRAKADIHLEATVEALEGNPLFLKPGQWVPYLDVRYRIKKIDTGEEKEGKLMPMFASNGTHYGNNVKLMGIGNYKVTIIVGPPTIMVHTDKETRPGKIWEKPIEVSWFFQYFGTGKKGGY